MHASSTRSPTSTIMDTTTTRSRTTAPVAIAWLFLPALACACGDNLSPDIPIIESPDGSLPPDSPPPDASVPDASPDPVDAGMPDPGLPDVTVTFPPPASFTDATSITIRGRASDPDGVAAIRVAGVLASTEDEFANWQHTVDLSPGINVIEIQSEDALGNRDDSAAVLTVRSGVMAIVAPKGVALDPANNRIFIGDGRGTLIAVDATSGAPTIIAAHQSGNSLAIAFDADNNRVLTADSGFRELASVDPDSGARTLIAGRDVGSGPELASPQGVALDTVGNRAIVADFSALLAVDLTSRERTVLSDATTGSGPMLQSCTGLALDLAGRRALVVDDGLGALLAIDLVTGNRVILSDAATGAGPALRLPRGVALDAANNRALVTDLILRAVVTVDLESGDREVLSDGEVGRGIALRSPVGLALDVDNERIWVADRHLDALIAIDPNSGDRTVLSQGATGVGLVMEQLGGVTIDPRDGRILFVHNAFLRLDVLDLATGAHGQIARFFDGSITEIARPADVVLQTEQDRALVTTGLSVKSLTAVDLTAGTRTVLSGDAVGSGPPLEFPGQLALDAANHRALVVDRPGILLSIDLESGDRRVISDVGTGPDLQELADVAVDRANNRALVVDRPQGAVVAIDLASNDRTIVSNSTTGAGPELVEPRLIVMDESGQRALVLSLRFFVDGPRAALIEIDLESGDRRTISDADRGAGPTLGFPQGMTLDMANNRVVFGDSLREALFIIDLDSGERVIVANNDPPS